MAKFEIENHADVQVLYRLYMDLVRDKLMNFTVKEAFDSAALLAQ